MSDVQLAQNLFQAFVATRSVQVCTGLENGENVVGNRKASKHRSFLRQITHAQLRTSMHGLMRQVLVIEFDGAGIGADQADDHVEGRGLASAIGAQQTDDLAGLHLQRQILHHAAIAVALAQMRGAQY
jgi:hypothetical protein